MPIKSFKGKIGDGDQDVINLHTVKGLVGYRIVKFEVMPVEPGISSAENIVKIYKIQQSSVDGKIDFSDNTLLAAGYYQSESSSYSDWQTTIFDNEIFNQDIYITHFDARTGEGINYYMELEQILLAIDESTVATLKDLRNLDRN